MPSALETFLNCHPWSETGLLERVFDLQALRSLVRMGPLRISTSEWGERWAVPDEADMQALALPRLETARAFAWWNFGRDGFFSSRSPGEHCDMEVLWKGKAWSIFVDPGGIAPEAIPWIQRPPAVDGPRVVLSDRASLLATWIEECWSGDSVQIGGRFAPPWSYVAGKSDPFLFSVQPRWRGRRKKLPPSFPDVDQLPLPLENSDLRLSINSLGRLSLIGGPWLVPALSSIGFLPFLTNPELHFLDPNLFSASHLQFLRSEGLVEGDRATLSPSGLRMISAYWGTDPKTLSKRHPWPLRYQSRNRYWAYSTAGAARFGAHDTLVRQFALSLVDGARRISRPDKEIHVAPLTILGSRIRFGHRNEKLSTVQADARLSLRLFHGLQPQRDCDLLVEVDRGTYSLQKLRERLEKYRELLKDSSSKLELILVFPSREREENAILMLQAISLDAWTVTEPRLALPERDNWWIQNPYLGAELTRESVGGFSPWRPIWKRSLDPDRLANLLGID